MLLCTARKCQRVVDGYEFSIQVEERAEMADEICLGGQLSSRVLQSDYASAFIAASQSSTATEVDTPCCEPGLAGGRQVGRKRGCYAREFGQLATAEQLLNLRCRLTKH